MVHRFMADSPWTDEPSTIKQFPSNPAHEQQQDHDQQDEPDAAAGDVAPLATVRPGGDGADEQKDQHDDQDGSEHGSLHKGWGRVSVRAPEKHAAWKSDSNGFATSSVSSLRIDVRLYTVVIDLAAGLAANDGGGETEQQQHGNQLA